MLVWKCEHMPGPTPEAKALQLLQYRAYDAWVEARHTARQEGEESSAEINSAREAYDATVTQLVALLGDEASCHQVDSEKYQEFSDFYKDVTGCRPRHHITRDEVDAWVKHQTGLQLALED